MKPFTISEQEREEILRQHIEATGRHYLPESKHETEEIYSFKNDTSAPSTGYSDMDLKDFDEFNFDLGFDAPSLADVKRLENLDKKASKGFLGRKPKFMGHEMELDEELSEGYSVPQMIRDLKDSTGITDAHLDDIMNGDETALEDAKIMYGYTDEGTVRRGILDKLDYLANAKNPEEEIDFEEEY
jgi:hypothetical protein